MTEYGADAYLIQFLQDEKSRFRNRTLGYIHRRCREELDFGITEMKLKKVLPKAGYYPYPYAKWSPDPYVIYATVPHRELQEYLQGHYCAPGHYMGKYFYDPYTRQFTLISVSRETSA